ncbi:MAG: CBS domain-containing protein [Candidatus Marsarchaeota archaeon]|jgi:CBS domain-containing protein|nr:CBS domain-containing protein [Candidatus Marsarchaeota archaeon]MCL5418882.1 CBS domain-containing protein [Candidatus Marsarchaeota archaeon]
MYSTNNSVRVREIMSSPVVVASENESIKSIAQKMNKHNINSVIITDNSNVPLGMITERDIIGRLLAKKRNLLFAKAKHVMTKPVVTISKDTTLEEAAKLMSEKHIKKLCVLDENSKIAGIITESDIIKNATYLIEVLKNIIDTGYQK